MASLSNIFLGCIVGCIVRDSTGLARQLTIVFAAGSRRPAGGQMAALFAVASAPRCPAQVQCSAGKALAGGAVWWLVGPTSLEYVNITRPRGPRSEMKFEIGR